MDPSDLYGLPPERFTEARASLTKELRLEGKREEATRVSKLRKPSLAAWAVNQLVRTQRREIGQLFKAGDALQKAQVDLLKGRAEPSKLRQAVEAERAANERLVGTARGLLSSEGHELTQARLDQVSETLHAAALDNEARARVHDGCLERELRHVGLGALAPAGARASPKQSRAKDRPRSTSTKAGGKERAKARQAETWARQQMERAKRELRAVQERRDQAADELRHMEDELVKARRRAEDATAVHREAEQAKRSLKTR